MIRDSIKTELTAAMKAGDKPRVGALRLVQSALKNRDIELRGAGGPPGDDDDALVAEVLRKMVKQRRESIDMYEKGGRQELAAAEAAELEVIEAFLPRQMSEAEAEAAIDAAIAEAGAKGPKDMGRVMALLKDRHAGTLDMAMASRMTKAKLG